LFKYDILKSRLFVFLSYFLLAILAFHQLSFSGTGLKWDTMGYVLPLRAVIDHAIHNFQLPLWNTFTHMGNPVCLDPTTWYPVTLFFSAVFGYDYTVMNYDFLLHLAIAAYAFFCLAVYLKIDRRVSFICGIAYMFSGFFISNSEHASFIVSAAWIPLIIYYFLKLAETYAAKDAVKAAACTAMLVLGGYPAFLFILIYLIAIFYFIRFIQLARNQQFSQIFKLVKLQCLAVVLIFFLCLSFVISYSMLGSLLYRSGDIPLWMVMMNPFPPNASISFLYPFVLSVGGIFQSDISMINIYVGIIPFLFVLTGIFRPMKRIQWILLALGLFFLITSFGQGFFLREFLYDYFPLMDLFRHPGLFRIFAILPLLLFSGITIGNLISEENEIAKKRTLWIYTFFAGIIILIGVYSFFQKNITAEGIEDPANFAVNCKGNLWDHIWIQSVNHLIVLGISLFLLFAQFSFVKKFRLLLIGLLFIWDLTISMQFNFYFTVGNYEKVYDAQKNDKKIRELKKKFTQYSTLPHYQASNYNPEYMAPCGNENLYYLAASSGGYDPFELNGYRDIMASGLKTLCDSNTIFYFPKRALRMADTITHYTKDVVYSNENLSGLIHTTVSDTLLSVQCDVNRVEAKISSGSENLLVLMQMYNPYWRAKVNGKETEIKKVNHNMMAIQVPKGNSEIKFEFVSKWSGLGFILNLLVWMGILYYLMLGKRKIPSN
jgi:hypothetical protein